MRMLHIVSAISIGLLGFSGSSKAETSFSPAAIIKVAGGCGIGAWRGPWGGCRNTPYVGPLPGGGWRQANGCAPGYWRGPWGYCRDVPYSGPLPAGGWQGAGNGCPPGFWRGPWGHCRDTPYHGPTPGGGWQ